MQMALARSLSPWVPGKQKRRPVTPAEQRLYDVERTGLSLAHRTAGCQGPRPLRPENSWGVGRGGSPRARTFQGSVAARPLLHLYPRRGLQGP